jgi:hypothetical protein
MDRNVPNMLLHKTRFLAAISYYSELHYPCLVVQMQAVDTLGGQDEAVLNPSASPKKNIMPLSALASDI